MEYGEFVHAEERREPGPLWDEIFFIFDFKGKGKYIIQVLKRSNTLKTIHFFRVSKGCFMSVAMYERSSKHLKKRMVICPDQNKRVFFPNMA